MGRKKENGTNNNTAYDALIQILNTDVGQYLSDRRNKRKVTRISLCFALLAGLLVVARLMLPAVALTGNYEPEYSNEIHQHDVSCYDENGNLICGFLEPESLENGVEAFAGKDELPIEAGEDTGAGAVESQQEGIESQPEETEQADTESQPEEIEHAGLESQSEETEQAGLESQPAENEQEGIESQPEEDEQEDIGSQPEENEQEDIGSQPEGTGQEGIESQPEEAEQKEIESQQEGSEQEDKDGADIITFTEKEGKLTVNVSAPKKAFPEGTVMKVTPVEEKVISDSVNDLIPQDIKGIEAVDISFFDKDGNEIEPEEAIQVTLQSDTIADVAGPTIVHVDDQGKAEIIEQLESEKTGQPVAEDEITFSADRFSTYALVYTLDLYEGDLQCQKKTYTITATFDEKAGIPAGTELHAEEVKKGSDTYNECIKKTESALKDDSEEETLPSELKAGSFGTLTPLVSEEPAKIGFARFFDISFVYEGKKIEPRAPVEVTIEYVKNVAVTDDQIPRVVHFASEGVELIDPQISLSVEDKAGEQSTNTDTDREVDTFSFTQSSFSITGTIMQVNLGSNEEIPEGDYVIATRKGVTENNVYNNYWDILSAGAPNNTLETKEVYSADSNNMSLGKFLSLYGNDNCIWNIKKSGNGYIIQNKNSGQKYLALSGSNNTSDNLISDVWSGSPPVLTVTYSGKSFQIKNSMYLGIKGNNSRIFVNKNSSSSVNLFRINTPQESSGTGYDPKLLDVDFLKKWEETLLNSKAIHNVGKTAEVYDYNNRIYQVDLTADSGMLAMNESLDLAFITDISNSMLFSSSLQDTGRNFRFSWNSDGTKNVNLNEAFPDKDQVYIIIGDPHRESCHYAVWYEKDGWWDPRTNSWYGKNQWLCLDASYYSKWRNDILTNGNANSYYSQYVQVNSSKTLRLPDVLQFNDPDSGKFSPNQDYPVYLPSNTWLSGFGDIYSNNDGSNAGNRLYYIKKSIKEAVASMQTVARVDNNQNIRVALETFCKGVPEAHNQTDKMYVAGSAGIDFTDISDLSALNSHVTAITTDDGTDQRNALEQFNSGFASYDYAKNWNADDGKKKVVVVISDGSPNEKGDIKSTPESVRQAAAKLEAKGATVISIALSMNDVEYGKAIMYNIATADKNGSRSSNYYQAENENDLAYIFYDILKKLIAEATVTGKVEDTIDEAFYPVDKNGNPLSEGTCIDLQGNVITDTAGANVDMPGIGKLTKVGDNWKVEWNNETIGWPGYPAETNPGWHGTVYVKVKEDFLGANTVNTNKGEAVITPDTYFITTNSGAGNLPIPEEKKNSVSLDTPHVNIDELSLTQESTSWRVYLNSTVDPTEQIKSLLNNIQVNEVVSKTEDDNDSDTGPDHIIRDVNGGILKYDTGKTDPDQWAGEVKNDGEPDSGREAVQGYAPEQFTLLWTLEKNCGGSLTDTEINTLLSGGTVTRNYGEYGHPHVGEITLSLNRKSESHPAVPGEGQAVEDYLEEYELKAVYTPKTVDQRKSQLNVTDEDYHTGNWGTKKPGAATGTMTSTNKHVITIFQKALNILKIDQQGKPITSSPATFTLYREATEDEIADDTVEKKTGEQLNLIGMQKDKKYVSAGTGSTQQTNSSTGENVITGLAIWNPVYPNKNPGADPYFTGNPDYYAEETEFYLVEEIPPEGYSGLPAPVKVTLNLIETGGEDNKAKVDGVELYDREQQARLYLSAEGESSQFVPVAKTGDQVDTLDSETRNVLYQIINSQGYELPETGGRGTGSLYLLGTFLLLSAGAALIARKKSLI